MSYKKIIKGTTQIFHGMRSCYNVSCKKLRRTQLSCRGYLLYPVPDLRNLMPGDSKNETFLRRWKYGVRSWLYIFYKLKSTLISTAPGENAPTCPLPLRAGTDYQRHAKECWMKEGVQLILIQYYYQYALWIKM